MYNTDLPTRAELPSTKQLIRSTVLAILAAAVILITVVLPSEYAIDPTGVGRVLGLAQMGEIKVQLAEEAEADRLLDQQTAPSPSSDQRSSLGDIIGQFFISSAAAHSEFEDEMSATLAPGQSAEIKLKMNKGATANYMWTATDKVNFDLHAHANGQNAAYKRGRGAMADEGQFTAEFDGYHGWFWRNRTDADVTITLHTSGEYAELKRME
ncbi:MAG: transmembrane anchor protein [Rhodospirillaceae bacterium]